MADTSDDEFEAILGGWADRISAELQLERLDQTAINRILDLAGVAAHGVLRPAAPLTTFLAGVAIGRDPELDLEAVVRQIKSLLPDS